MECWKQYSEPKIVNEKTTKAATMIKQVYEYNPVGSNLHIVLDDWNLEDNHVKECLNWIGENVHKSTPEQIEIEKELANMMLAMNMAERASALAISIGWVS